MKSIKRINTVENTYGIGTAAPTFHMSDTLDWSCFSARIKNQTVIVPRYSGFGRSVVELADIDVEYSVTKNDGREI